MKTYLDCIPCFFKQALRASRMFGVDENLQKRIINDIAREVVRFPLSCSPPEMGRIIYASIRKYTDTNDPYKSLKEESNKIALSLYEELSKIVKNAHDPFFTALKLAVAGNLIDYGVVQDFDIKKEIFDLLEKDFALLDYDEFKDSLNKANNILYLADNAGEIVFDHIFIKGLKEKTGKDITLAVRGAPIINDATMDDALFCGIQHTVPIVQNGYDAPGTILPHCSKEFLNIYNKSDMVISKGQGNFESLSEKDKNIFFLFKVKCRCVADHVGVALGNIVMVSNKRYIKK